MSSKFCKAYNKTIANEGGYVNIKADRGGETYKGIARNFWPDWDGWNVIDIYKTKYTGKELDANLEKNVVFQNLVKLFYKRNFYDELNCDAFADEIACELFDTAVNQGRFMAASHFQKTLNKLNRNQKDYNDINQDGRIGSGTIGAYNALIATASFKSRSIEKIIKWILKWLNYYQLERYAHITDKNKSQEIFIPGWTERT